MEALCANNPYALQVAMPKRYGLIAFFTGSMLCVALSGYFLFGNTAQSDPTRIRFDNVGGLVVFDHKKHAVGYDIACERCHHESSVAREHVQPCGTCHGVTFDKDFQANHMKVITDKASCVTCHHSAYEASNWNHDEHVEAYGLSCTDCHHEPDIEPTPTNCADCHESTGYDSTAGTSIPSIKTAVHSRCANCHQEMFDENLAGCANCHEFTNKRTLFNTTGDATIGSDSADCMMCHTEKLEDLIPGRMAAFHGQCFTCHQEVGKGPYKKDQCQQCHIK